MTEATELMMAAFRALTPAEQEDVLAALAALRDERLREGAPQSAAERGLASMRKAADRLGRKGSAEEIENVGTLTRCFGSWRAAKEALELGACDHSARRIEARFAGRRLGKVWRYSEQTLRSALERCVAELGHVPQLAEFEHWRRGMLDALRARGDDAAHLPSGGPYRRRYGSWEQALLALGYTPDRVAERLEGGAVRLPGEGA